MSKLPSLDALRSELQGPRGLIQKAKNEMMPSGEQLAEKAWQTASFAKKELTPKIVRRNFNQYLCELIDLEYQLYLQYEEDCINKGVLEIAVQGNLKHEYPAVSRLVDAALKIVSRTDVSSIEKLSEIGAHLRPFYRLLEQSFAQGRMTRAGGSSQLHLERLLRLAGYTGEFQMQQVLNGTVDFLFPDKSVWDLDRQKCVVVSIKRTLRERYKQVFEELGITKGMTIFLLVTEKLDESEKDISGDKVRKLHSENVYLVVRDEIKSRRFSNAPNVIGFTQFINSELPRRRSLWRPVLRSVRKK